jgi:hypothetical protein
MSGMRTYYGTKRVEAWPKEAINGPGYAVRYPDGYESWSPEDVFEAAYHVETDMPFEGALTAMREGRKVQRIGIDPPDVAIFLKDDEFFAERKAVGAIGRWHPSVRDLLARWTVVE